MSENRFALLIASCQYEDTNIGKLIAPANDLEALAKVLRDPKIGDFHVDISLNDPHYVVRQLIDEFFQDRRKDDLLLLYFSGHGFKENELYFTASDTKLKFLRSTGISASYVNDLMENSKSRSQVLILDCCFSGAFIRGMVSKGDKKINVKEHFNGYGKVVLTSSDSAQYSYEGETISGEGVHSIFTNAIVRGLETGDADLDKDNLISVLDLYKYVNECVSGELQHPTINTFAMKEEIYIARSQKPTSIVGQMFKYDVFICYSTKDEPIIDALIKDFKKEDITYWVDAEQILIGDQITEKIYEGLIKSKYVIPCVSKNLKTSGWQRTEYSPILIADFKGNTKRRVIPLLLDDCGENDIPLPLRDKKRVTYSNKAEFSEFIEILKKNRKEQQDIEDSLKKENEDKWRHNEEIDRKKIKEQERKLLDIESKQREEEAEKLQKQKNVEKSEVPKALIWHDIEFVLIPAGEFKMGSKVSSAEQPIHRVAIKEPFYLSKYPVTQRQWIKVMSSNPSVFNGEDRPVENISWNDVQDFIAKLNEKEGTIKYRLPSEAEWEYACKAGAKTSFSFGDEESKLEEYAWYGKNSDFETHPVGHKKPNPWGLYDMHGNIFEWCQDKWHNSYDEAPSDGSAWESGIISYRVDRGGSWSYSARYCRSAYRNSLDPYDHSGSIGFRVVRDIKP